jgi:hypothetical protein
VQNYKKIFTFHTQAKKYFSGKKTKRNITCGDFWLRLAMLKQVWHCARLHKNCKNRDSPISPRDPQASTTISGGFPLTEKWSVSDFLIGVSLACNVGGGSAKFKQV